MRVINFNNKETDWLTCWKRKKEKKKKICPLKQSSLSNSAQLLLSACYQPADLHSRFFACIFTAPLFTPTFFSTPLFWLHKIFQVLLAQLIAWVVTSYWPLLSWWLSYQQVLVLGQCKQWNKRQNRFLDDNKMELLLPLLITGSR